MSGDIIIITSLSSHTHAQTGNIPASECVMVEDSMKNVRAAKALGMGTVLISGADTGNNKDDS
jgi:FMN phosphatase YigB (HAD superfamily)